MDVISIRKRRSADSFIYEIDDFPAYVKALKARGIEAPLAKYKISIPYDVEQQLRGCVDINEQVALFFRIGPASGLKYEILDLTNRE